jgi:hypothetical protein
LTDGRVLYLAGESVVLELWAVRCVGMDSDTADIADSLTCEPEEETCGCRGGGAAGLLLLPLLWSRRRRL